MKQITNWRNATVFDIEADNLLDDATKIYCLSFKSMGETNTLTDYGDIKQFFLDHLHKGIPLVAHNGIAYDIPLAEKILGIDLSENMVIDTLMLSWALNTKRPKHGLDSFFPDYGIKKPVIDDWENLTVKEYCHRCEEDVKINTALWSDFMGRLDEIYTTTKIEIDNLNVGGRRVSEDEVTYLDRYVNNSTLDEYVDRYITFLMYKGDTGRLREETKFEADIPHINKVLGELEVIVEEAKVELEKIMPPVAEWKTKSYPKNPRKKDKTLSAHGKAWNDALDLIGQRDQYGEVLAKKGKTDKEIILLKGYKEPNANSVKQIKDLLFMKGWQPTSFKFEAPPQEDWDAWKESGYTLPKPSPRKIPQVTVDSDAGKVLCSSVEVLAESSPEIMKYAKYGMLKHRLGMFKGFLRDEKNGYLTARVNGYTNTLRDKHGELVNMAGVDKAYGTELRGSLIAGEGKIALGSDLSSLEDRVKHHFMLAYDPEYVNTMMDSTYDPHIQMALTAGLISQEQFDDFKAGNPDAWTKKARKMGKACNYASVYGAGGATIARSAGVSKGEGENLHAAYWKLNWSVTAIAEDQTTFTDSRGGMWLINPINGFCYSLRAEKDIFSTLCQGTGSFFFDRWVDYVLEGMYSRFGVKRLSACFHDEFVSVFKDTEANRKIMEEITLKAIDNVNEEYMLRRDLGCDVQFGTDYSQIH